MSTTYQAKLLYGVAVDEYDWKDCLPHEMKTGDLELWESDAGTQYLAIDTNISEKFVPEVLYKLEAKLYNEFCKCLVRGGFTADEVDEKFKPAFHLILWSY